MRATIAIILLLINMIIVAVCILILFCLIHLLPLRSWRHRGFAWLQKWPVWWMDVNYWILQLSTYKKWQIESTHSGVPAEGNSPIAMGDRKGENRDSPPSFRAIGSADAQDINRKPWTLYSAGMAGIQTLHPQNWYLLLCNHQSWMDILVLGVVFRKQLPILKFFMKKELLWSLPVAGWACYVLGYPFMARHSHEEVRRNPQLKTRDIETTRQACGKFKDFPTVVVNFVEGTRFTAAKHDAQQSPYRRLLKPKATGVALVLQELHPQLSGILNVTLHYKPQNLSLWDFLSGKIEKIYLHYELLPITPDLVGDPYEDRVFRRHFQQWLNGLWQEKDQLLDKLSL